MNSHSFTLYSDSKLVSPYVMSNFIALTEKDLAFELKTVDLAENKHSQAPYADVSLSKRVPSLVHQTSEGESFTLSESSAISEYLEDRFAPPEFMRLYPSDLQAKAKAREIQAWLRSDLVPIRDERPTEVIYFQPVEEPLSQNAVAAANKLFSAVERLLSLSDGPNLFGEWCVADADLALMINRLVMNGDRVPEKVATYATHQWQRPSVQLWVNQTRGE